MKKRQTNPVAVPTGRVRLNGDLTLGEDARGLVLFAHGSGSSRLSPRNQYVAGILQDAGIGTLLFDLLTADEEQEDYFTAHLRFDIDLLARRLEDGTRWALEQSEIRELPLGYFGASTGAAAALIAASRLGDQISAVVSRGGRPDLAGEALPAVKASTLLIVGGEDHTVIRLNEQAYERLTCHKQLQIIPGATHLFEERGALEQVARLASEWFLNHLHALEHKTI